MWKYDNWILTNFGFTNFRAEFRPNFRRIFVFSAEFSFFRRICSGSYSKQITKSSKSLTEKLVPEKIQQLKFAVKFAVQFAPKFAVKFADFSFFSRGRNSE